MACPYFYPTEPFTATGKKWVGKPELPLGDGYTGKCLAVQGEEVVPPDEFIKEYCNYGYALRCPRFPEDAPFHGFKYALIRDKGKTLTVYYILERERHSLDHGSIDYDVESGALVGIHDNDIVNQQVLAYAKAYLAKKQAPYHRGKAE